MEDPDLTSNFQTLKELTIKTIHQCADPGIIDLIYKILLMERI